MKDDEEILKLDSEESLIDLDTSPILAEIEELDVIVKDLIEPFDASFFGHTIELTEDFKSISESFADMSSLGKHIGVAGDFKSISESFADMSSLGKHIGVVDGFKSIGENFGASVLSEQVEVSQGLEEILKVLKDNKYNVATIMVSGVYVENVVNIEDFSMQEDYYEELLDILFEWYTTLLVHLQQVWNVITSETAMQIVTLASLLFGILSVIGKKNSTPQISVHNYSNDVEIETKTDGNQIDIYVQEKPKK